MKKWLSVVFMSVSLFAQDMSNASLSGLPKEKQAEIIQQIEKAKAEAKNPTSNPQVAKEWVSLGKDVAELIPVFAEKTGIAADKVLNSFSGKVLLAIVIVHFFWSKIIGILLLSFGPIMWWLWFRRMFLLEKQERSEHPIFGKLWMRKINYYGSIRTTLEKGYSSIPLVTAVWLGVSIAMLAAIFIGGIVGVCN